MSMNFAILGILSVAPMTGYDLKKIMQESSFMYWSGNNNQIYKALLELKESGYVTSEVMHGEKSPSKKIYTITSEGISALKKWLYTTPEAPEFKNAFLVQLAWADLLQTKEILALLDTYEQYVEHRHLMEKAKSKNGQFSPSRSPREATLWALVHENILCSYASELRWIAAARQKLEIYPDSVPCHSQNLQKGELEMTYEMVNKETGNYLLLPSGGIPITKERDALDLISLCAQYDTNRLLIENERISDEFMNLSTGVAGAVIQKLTQYSIKAAVTVDEARTGDRFKELVLEMNKGGVFRFFADADSAEQWLLK